MHLEREMTTIEIVVGWEWKVASGMCFEQPISIEHQNIPSARYQHPGSTSAHTALEFCHHRLMLAGSFDHGTLITEEAQARRDTSVPHIPSYKEIPETTKLFQRLLVPVG